MVKPTFTGRRSKEERTALEKEALEREKARTKEREDADRKKRNEADKKARRDAERATRGRGGYSGAMSGPFSLGSSREGRSQPEGLISGWTNKSCRSQEQQPQRVHLRVWVRFKSTACQR
jgi:DNA-directed RNA polymerase III subunit RPC4